MTDAPTKTNPPGDKPGVDIVETLREIAHSNEADGYSATARRVHAAADEIERLREALKPFADCVFNDNGEVTVDTSTRPTFDDYVAAYFALRKALSRARGASQ